MKACYFATVYFCTRFALLGSSVERRLSLFLHESDIVLNCTISVYCIDVLNMFGLIVVNLCV